MVTAVVVSDTELIQQMNQLKHTLVLEPRET